MSGFDCSAKETLVAHEVTRNGRESITVANEPKTIIVERARRCLLCKRSNKFPCAVFVIVGLGISLLCIIVACVVHETVRSGIEMDRRAGYAYHNLQDAQYHRQIVSYINNLSNSTWKAKYNRFASRAKHSAVDLDEMAHLTERNKRMRGDQLFGDTDAHLTKLKQQKVTLPENFDSRRRWSLCWSVHQVANQGGCGSCWAMSATSVMSDRLCVASNYSIQSQVSAQDLTSCCSQCGGCQGSHWALAAFTHWKEHGIVTGGNYGSFEGCKPYTVAPDCGGPCAMDFYEKWRTPNCENRCQDLYEYSYHEDLTKGERAYWIRADKGSSEMTPGVQSSIRGIIPEEDAAEMIQREVFLYGPVLACFTVYEDFQHYSSGIYHPLTYPEAKELYGHCAKLLGWGVEQGEKYWLYMNTWGREWGENGFFRIAFDEIPEEAVAGTPLL